MYFVWRIRSSSVGTLNVPILQIKITRFPGIILFVKVFSNLRHITVRSSVKPWHHVSQSTVFLFGTIEGGPTPPKIYYYRSQLCNIF